MKEGKGVAAETGMARNQLCSGLDLSVCLQMELSGCACMSWVQDPGRSDASFESRKCRLQPWAGGGAHGFSILTGLPQICSFSLFLSDILCFFLLLLFPLEPVLNSLHVFKAERFSRT